MIYPGYEAYQTGLEAGIFIKDLTGEDYYIGQVWPGATHFPDFLHPKTQVSFNLYLNISFETNLTVISNIGRLNSKAFTTWSRMMESGSI
jgi:alpha-glucosidase (family GH31 glycosyl hydrolase)